MLGQRKTWRGFLRTNKSNPSANLLLSYGGNTPRDTKERVKSAHRAGRIDLEETERILGYIADWQSLAKGDGGYVDNKDRRDWLSLGDGGYQRAKHLEVYA